MSFHLLDSVDLAASLRAAALLPQQLWMLPAGRIELNETISLDLWDRSLRLQARPGTTLVLNQSLQLSAGLLELEGLAVEGPGSLRLEAGSQQPLELRDRRSRLHLLASARGGRRADPSAALP